MSGLWHPNDLVTDRDLQDYESAILTQFGQTDWQRRRQKAIDDWLFQLMEGRGFAPERFRTRAAPDKVWSYDGSAYTDQTTASGTSDGVNLASLLSSSAKYLYIGAKTPFRGVSIRMLDSVNSASITLTTEVWADRWAAPVVTDGTAIGQKPLARGGALTWAPVDGVVRRAVNSSDAMYWVRLNCSGTPTGAVAGPLSVIRRSRLAPAAIYRTLELIFREAPTSQDGPWREKADFYAQEAEKAWLRVADHIGPEFDTDDDDRIDGDENTQTAQEVTGGGWTLERA